MTAFCLWLRFCIVMLKCSRFCFPVGCIELFCFFLVYSQNFEASHWDISLTVFWCSWSFQFGKFSCTVSLIILFPFFSLSCKFVSWIFGSSLILYFSYVFFLAIFLLCFCSIFWEVFLVLNFYFLLACL